MAKKYFQTKETLATYVIATYVQDHCLPQVQEADVHTSLQSKGACFVSVYVGGKLRGCIGSWRPFEPLYQNIIRHAVEAITLDFRFPQVSAADLPNFTVEVSVLSRPKPWRPKNTEELLAYVAKTKPGVILENSGKRALFLPQVWESLPRPPDFLSHLCLKAGLAGDAWQAQDTKFWIFTTT